MQQQQNLTNVPFLYAYDGVYDRVSHDANRPEEQMQLKFRLQY